MSDEKNAVFLSYGSNDAEAAGRICTAPSAGDIDVGFDQNEVRGDARDAPAQDELSGLKSRFH